MSRLFQSLPIWAKVLVVILIISTLVNLIWILVVFWNDNSDAYPAKGGIYVEASVGSLRHINPILPSSGDAERDLINLIFEGLQKYDPKTSKIVSGLADCTVDATATIYTCTLRDNLTWQDGQPLTLDDVLFTYNELAKNPELPNSSLRAIFENVILEQVDEHIVKFTLPSPNAFFASELTLGILPRHLLGLLPVSNMELTEFNLQPVGAGPYKLDSLKKENDKWTARLSIFENYHDQTAKIEKLVLYYYPAYTNLAGELSSFNAVRGIPSTEVGRFQNDSRFVLQEFTLPQYVALFLNNSSDKLKNAKLRYGLLLATDKQAIADFADGNKVDTPFLGDGNQFDIGFSEERARGALNDAGWELPLNENGEKQTDAVRTKKNDDKVETLTLKAITASTPVLYEQVLRQIKAQWEKVGVNLEISILPIEEFQTAVINRDYDVLLYGQNFGYNPDLAPFWHSKNADKGLNFSNYKNFTVDFMLDQAQTQLSAEARNATFDKIAQNIAGPVYDTNGTLVNGVAGIFLYTPRFYFAADQRVKGLDFQTLAYSADRFLEIRDWYVWEEKQLKNDLDFGKVWQWFTNKL